jgi:hypothetical protein
MEFFEDLWESTSSYINGPSQSDIIRQASGHIRQNVRKLEREKIKGKQKESQLIAELKKAGPKATKPADLRSLALQIARQRRGITQIEQFAFSLAGMEQQLLQTEVSTTMNSVMMNVTQALSMSNGMASGTNTGMMLQEYQKQVMLLDVKHDMLDDLQNDEDEEISADDLLAQLADEIDLQTNFEMPTARNPKTKDKPAPPATLTLSPEEAASNDELLDLEKRLANLK